jgi:hypothetical protein
MDHERLQQAIATIELQRRPDYYGAPATRVAEIPADPHKTLIGGELFQNVLDATRPIIEGILPTDLLTRSHDEVEPINEQWDMYDIYYEGLEPIFHERPNLKFDPIPPVIDPKILKDSAAINSPPREDGTSRPPDVSGMPFENIGSIRALNNLVHPLSPSDADKKFVAVLRSIVRHDNPIPLGVISYETGLDVETVDRLTDNLPTIIRDAENDKKPKDSKYTDPNGEVWVQLPEVRAYAIEATKSIDFTALGLNAEELSRLEDSLKTLRFIEEDQTILPSVPESYAAD